MIQVLVLDDDDTILTLIKAFLSRDGFAVNTFNSGLEALESLKSNNYDIIISDLIMPVMSGDEFLKNVKAILPEIPFIFITGDKKLNTVKKVMKMGADDYWVKPIEPKYLSEKVKGVIDQKVKDLAIKNTFLDSLIEKRDQRRLVSWKDLYGMKEVEQSNKIMSFLSRNIEQAGSFMWLDMLKSQLELAENDTVEITLNKTMLELIIESTDYIKRILDDLKYVNTLKNETILLEFFDIMEFIDFFKSLYETDFIPAAIKYNKKLNLDIIGNVKEGFLEINNDSIKMILLEILYNCIKYSPQDSKINIYIDAVIKKDKKYLEISYWNLPVSLEIDGEKSVLGIPYEYSEAVFDLFYTIEKLPVRIEEEEWSQGTGLFIVRKLLQKMNSFISAQNVVMHTIRETTPYVKTSIHIPIQ